MEQNHEKAMKVVDSMRKAAPWALGGTVLAVLAGSYFSREFTGGRPTQDENNSPVNRQAGDEASMSAPIPNLDSLNTSE